MAIPSGEIYLLRNVPLTASYEHTIDFKNRDEQFNYFYSFLKHSVTKVTYVRKEREYISLELPITALEDVNYMIFRAAEDERIYYAFVNDKVFVNPVTSHISYSIDVMQSFQFDYKWNASYIRQAHVDRWTPEFKPIYSTTEEGLDYGTEYTVESAYSLEQSSRLRWLLVTLKDYSEVLNEGYDTNIGYFSPVESPFACALVPIIIGHDNKLPPSPVVWVDASNSDFSETVISSYIELVKYMQKSAFGNFIQSISLLTYNPFVLSDSVTSDVLYRAQLNPACTFGKAVIGEDANHITLLIIRSAPKAVFNGLLARADWDEGLTGAMPTAEQWSEIKKNPYTTKRDKRFESKLLCAPYRYNLLTDWRSAPVIYKNEYLPTTKIEVNYSCAASYNAPFRFWLKGYKGDPEGRYTSLSQPIASEMPIISDAYYSYMLENKNTIQANITNSIISAATGAVSGAISGGGVGGSKGAAFGAITGAISGALNIQANIRSENAKQADLKGLPDTIINSNDSAFNIADKVGLLNFYRMKINCNNEHILSEIWNMSGYKVNRVDIPNTRSRLRFNFIQTLGANITGPISQTYLTQLKEIFNNGVTIWHYNEHFKMLDYSLENIEVNLI